MPENIKEQNNSKAKTTYEALKKECRTYGELWKKIHDYGRNSDFSKHDEVVKWTELNDLFREETDNIPIIKVMYLCDGRVPDCKKSYCIPCGSEDGCQYTSDIEHAENFTGSRRGLIYERNNACNDAKTDTAEKIPQKNMHTLKILVDDSELQQALKTITELETHMERMEMLTRRCKNNMEEIGILPRQIERAEDLP